MDFINKVFYVFKNKYLGLFVEFVNSVIIVRYLGVENYGHYTVLYIIPLLVSSLGSFGFGPSIVYHINKSKFNIGHYLTTFAFMGLTIGLIYVSVIIFFMAFINDYIYDNVLDSGLFLISIFFIPIMITQKYLRAK